MQRQRSGLDLFPESIDLNQRSIPSSTTNTDNIHPLSWCENSINQVEARFPNYMRVTNEDQSINPVITTNDSAPSFSRLDHGESSSSGFNQRDKPRNEISKSRLGWSPSSSYNPSSQSENWFFEPFNSPSSASYHGAVRSQSSQSYYSANRGSLNVTRNHGHVRESEDSQRHVLGAVLPHSIYKSGRQEVEQPPSYPSSSSNLGSCNNIVEHNDASGSGFAAWGGSSCKRKAAEGTSASSSSNQLTGKNVMQHHGTSCYNSPGNLFISSGPLNASLNSHSEPQNSSNRFGLIPPPALNFSTRSNLGQHETVSDDHAVSSSLRSSGVNHVQEHFSRPTSTSSAPRTLRIDPNNSLSRASTHERTYSSSSPWNGSLSSQQGGSSSSSHINEEADHTRRSRRDNLYYPTNVSDTETRNSVVSDRIDWSFVPEMSSSSSSRNRSYGSRNGSNSNAMRPSSSSWLPHHYRRHHQASQNHHQRFSEAAPWIQYPSGNNNNSSNNRRSHFGLIPSVSSPSNEAGSSNRAQRQLDQSSAAALLMDISRNDANGWDAITAVEERHRLIRQVLNAMRREVYLRAEDYMIFDPYMDEYAELHDRHRDMRLDVDNMSYEELLALEERIGNVSTGLSEEKITGSLKQRKHNSLETMQNSEPCCICQEEFLTGDAIGILDCAHEFHTSCIKQWLTQKNLCPICKMTALET